MSEFPRTPKDESEVAALAELDSDRPQCEAVLHVPPPGYGNLHCVRDAGHEGTT